LQGARSALGEQLRRSLLITKAGHVQPQLKEITGITVIEAGHPYPDEHSLRAGQAMLDFIAATPPDAQLLFLISGGASSLVEVLPQGVGVDQARRACEWLLASGLAINDMNALRKRISRIKGGRLAAYLGDRSVLQLIISDVPGDSPADVGSGLLVPEDELQTSLPALPQWFRELLEYTPPPAMDPVHFVNIESHVAATLDDAMSAAALETKKMGYTLQVHTERLNGDALSVGRRLANELIAGVPGVHIWGGETTVVLPSHPGRGGRNQHLALAAAEVFAGHDNVWLLAAGTDGSDGEGEDAGALVDGGTVLRGAQQCLDAGKCLLYADAGTFLAASCDLITTGPTGTNVMDLVIGVKD